MESSPYCPVMGNVCVTVGLESAPVAYPSMLSRDDCKRYSYICFRRGCRGVVQRYSAWFCNKYSSPLVHFSHLNEIYFATLELPYLLDINQKFYYDTRDKAKLSTHISNKQKIATYKGSDYIEPPP